MWLRSSDRSSRFSISPIPPEIKNSDTMFAIRIMIRNANTGRSSVLTPKGAADAAQLCEADRRHLFHPFTALAEHERSGPSLIITKGEGVWLEDVAGRKYLDVMAGLWCVNAGYGHREIAQAME